MSMFTNWDKEKSAKHIGDYLKHKFSKSHHPTEFFVTRGNTVTMDFIGIDFDISFEGGKEDKILKVVLSSETGLNGIEDYVRDYIDEDRIFMEGYPLGRIDRKHDLPNYRKRLKLRGHGFEENKYFFEYSIEKMPKKLETFRNTIIRYALNPLFFYARYRAAKNK